VIPDVGDVVVNAQGVTISDPSSIHQSHSHKIGQQWKAMSETGFLASALTSELRFGERNWSHQSSEENVQARIFLNIFPNEKTLLSCQQDI
jgi:hypothetical protein